MKKGYVAIANRKKAAIITEKKPQIKVVNCGGFTMKGALREVLKVLIKDGEQE